MPLKVAEFVTPPGAIDLLRSKPLLVYAKGKTTVALLRAKKDFG